LAQPTKCGPEKTTDTRLVAASDKDYQLLAHSQWFSPGTPASSTTKTGRQDIARILLKVALKHQSSKIKSKCGGLRKFYVLKPPFLMK
jgi:hypothetical protein